MGTFLSTLLVRDTDVDELRSIVEEVGRDAPPEDVTLLRSGEWTAILLDMLSELDLGEIAKAIRKPALRVLVHDSDEAQIELALDGRRIGKLSSRRHPKSSTALEGWRPLLRGEATLDELVKIWRDDPLFAEDLVVRTAALFGIDRELVLASPHDAHPEGAATFSIGTPEDEEPTPAGPARLWIFGWSGQREGAVGEPFEPFYRARNVGGPGCGLEVTVGGTAIEQGLVHIDSVELVEAVHRRAVELVRDGSGTLRGTVSDLVLAAGPGGYGTHVNVFLRGQVAAPGSGELRVALTPVGAEEKGAAHRLELEAVPVGRKPLRATTDLGAMRPLWREDVLTTWVLFDAPIDEARPHALEALVRYGAVLGPREYRRIAFAPDKKPREGILKSAQLTTAYLSKRLEGADSIQLTTPPTPGSERTDGMSLEQLTVFGGWSASSAVAHVGLWASITDRSREERDALEAAMERIVDELAAATPLRQAFVIAWGPALVGFDTNPYEQACGIHGQCTSQRPWTERWLRAVSPRMWLGRSLRTHIDEARVATVAGVVELPHGVLRLSTPSDRLDELELALAPILADAATYERALHRHYGR